MPNGDYLAEGEEHKNQILFMRKIFLFFAVLSGIVLQAQTLKTFTGTKVGELNVIGNVTYTYYEVKSEANLDYANRPEVNAIKHGAYKYVAKSTPKEGGAYSLTVSGNLKHGYKDGIWTYTQTLVDYPTNGSEFITGTKTIKISYEDGVPNGQWTYSNSQKVRTKSYNRQRGWYWNNDWKTKPTESAQVTYSNGFLTGSYSEKTLEWTGNIVSKTGQLNNNGFLIGNWKSENNYKTYSTDGYLIPEHDAELQKLQDEYKALPKEQYDDFFLKHHIKVDTLKYSHPSVFNNTMFETKHYDHHTDLKSDIKEKETVGGRFINFERVQIVPLERIIDFNNGPETHNQEELNEIYTKNKYKLTSEDKTKFERIIEKAQENQKIRDEEKRYENLCQQQYKEALELRKFEMPKILNCNLEELKIKSVEVISQNLHRISDYIKQDINLEEKYFGCNKNNFSTINFNKGQLYKERFENNKQVLELLKQKQMGSDSIIQVHCLYNEIFNNRYRVAYAYTSLEKDNPRSNGKYLPGEIKTKEKLYTAFNGSFNQLISNFVNGNKSFVEIYNSLAEMNDLCLYMLRVQKEKTKDVENELKAYPITIETRDFSKPIEIFRKYVNQ
jgi:hypothetical protein